MKGPKTGNSEEDYVQELIASQTGHGLKSSHEHRAVIVVAFVCGGASEEARAVVKMHEDITRGKKGH